MYVIPLLSIIYCWSFTAFTSGTSIIAADPPANGGKPTAFSRSSGIFLRITLRWPKMAATAAEITTVNHHLFGLSRHSQCCLKTITGWWWLEHVLFFNILGMSSSQLTNSIIFQRGRAQPPENVSVGCLRLIDVQIGNTLNAPCKGKVGAPRRVEGTDQSWTWW